MSDYTCETTIERECTKTKTIDARQLLPAEVLFSSFIWETLATTIHQM